MNRIFHQAQAIYILFLPHFCRWMERVYHKVDWSGNWRTWISPFSNPRPPQRTMGHDYQRFRLRATQWSQHRRMGSFDRQIIEIIGSKSIFSYLAVNSLSDNQNSNKMLQSRFLRRSTFSVFIFKDTIQNPANQRRNHMWWTWKYTTAISIWKRHQNVKYVYSRLQALQWPDQYQFWPSYTLRASQMICKDWGAKLCIRRRYDWKITMHENINQSPEESLKLLTCSCCAR